MAQDCAEVWTASDLELLRQKSYHILTLRDNGLRRCGSGGGNGTGLTVHSDNSTEMAEDGHPYVLQADLNHYRELFSKLKFKYLEQETKEKYLRAILDDTPQVVEVEDVEKQEQKNLSLRKDLKELKKVMAELIARSKNLARTVSTEYATVSESLSAYGTMLEEIGEMEQSLKVMKDEKEVTDQNLSLLETLALLEEREAELNCMSKTMQTNKEKFDSLCEKRKANERNLRDLQLQRNRSESLADEAERISSVKGNDKGSQLKLQNIELWYDKMTTKLKELLGIKNFSVDYTANTARIAFYNDVTVVIHYEHTRIVSASVNRRSVNLLPIIAEAQRLGDITCFFWLLRDMLQEKFA